MNFGELVIFPSVWRPVYCQISVTSASKSWPGVPLPDATRCVFFFAMRSLHNLQMVVSLCHAKRNVHTVCAYL